MITPAGIICRICRDPIRQEYLTTAEPPSPPAETDWSTDRDKAFEFSRYHDADDLAKKLGGRPIFAVTVSKSQPETPIPEEFSHVPRPSMIRRPRHRFAASYPNQ